MPSVKSFETDMRRARRKKRAKRNIKNFMFILAVAMVFGLVYLSRDAWLDFFDGILDRHQAAVQNDGMLAGGNYPIDISKKTHTKIGAISKDWTLFADTTFYVYDSSGDVVYSAQTPYSTKRAREPLYTTREATTSRSAVRGMKYTQKDLRTKSFWERSAPTAA